MAVFFFNENGECVMQDYKIFDEIANAYLTALDAVTSPQAMESYRFSFDLDQPNNVIPFNPATGRYNPLSPDLRMAVDGNKLVTFCTFANCYESAPDTVQGGMGAAGDDQLLAYATMIDGVTGPTLWLKVAYLKPTPIIQDVGGEGNLTFFDRAKWRGVVQITISDGRAVAHQVILE